MTANPLPSDFYPIEIPTPFPVGPVNVFLWKGDPLTLIDTGPRTEEAYDALRQGLADQGVAIADLERVILTHHHVDHVGLLRRILDESNAKSYAHPDVPSEHHPHGGDPAAWEAYLAGMFREFGVPEEAIGIVFSFLGEFRKLTESYHIDIDFEDGGAIAPFTTYFVPGHSVSDSLIVNHEDGYAIVGDHILETTNPNPLIHRPVRPDAPRMKSLVAYQRSLRRSHGLELGLCFPGHGAPFTDHRRVIDGILAKHNRREGRVLKRLDPAGSTPYQIATQLYPDMPPETIYLILSVAAGHLEVLEEKGLVRSEIREGIRYFVPVEAAK